LGSELASDCALDGDGPVGGPVDRVVARIGGYSSWHSSELKIACRRAPRRGERYGPE
jgi:hypothetical protein